MHTHDRPCAAAGLTSYRYKGPWGYIMIGALSHNDALKEALRSLEKPSASMDNLEVWDLIEGIYKPVEG